MPARPVQADSRPASVRPPAAPTREPSESARTLADADRRRLEASRQTRNLDDPSLARATRRPAEPERPVRPSVTRAPAAQDPAWPPTGARLTWPPTGPGQDRKAARQTSTSYLDGDSVGDRPAVPVRTPEPHSPTSRRAVPVPSASQTGVEPVRPTVREVAGDQRSADRLPTADRSWPPSVADAPSEPVPADPTAGDGWALFSDQPSADPVAQPKRPVRRHRARTFVVMTVVLAMVIGVGYVVATSLNLFATSSGGVSDYTGEGEGPVDVTVRKGDSGAAIARTLYDAEVVATQKAFVDVCRASSDCQSIRPGTYTLKKRMSAAAALAALLNPNNLKSGKLTIAEGKTATQIVEQISIKTGIPVADLNAAIADPASIGLPPEAGEIVEGWLYPTTYDVDPDATATQVLKMMVDKTVEVLTAKEVPQSDWQRVLIQASIVEREGGINTETGEDYRPAIARALQNRLDIGKPLEVDATTIYGNPDPDTPVSEKNKDAGNPYNTYKHTGLPPGPIASPGEVAIDAVLHPADGSWIYWVTINYQTRDTRFADTYPEHQQNVALLREWYNQQTQSPEP